MAEMRQPAFTRSTDLASASNRTLERRRLTRNTVAIAIHLHRRDRDPAALDLLITALRELAPADLPIAARCRDALQAYGEGAAELLGARLLDQLPTHDPNKE